MRRKECSIYKKKSIKKREIRRVEIVTKFRKGVY